MSHANAAAGGPTVMRYGIVAATVMTSIVLYLHRVCISSAGPSIRDDLKLADWQVDYVLSAFFLSYALGQVPSGWLSDRFGARAMMTIYVATWSLFTLLTGLASGFVMLIVFRLGFGLAQAGAYPTSAGLLTRWVTFQTRGRASAVVAFGGRVGGAIAPVLTTSLMAVVVAGSLMLGEGQGAWRSVMVIYGFVGLIVAIAFLVVYRNRPEEHPLCNRSEQLLIEQSRPPGSANPNARVRGLPILQLLSEPSIWLMCIAQFGTNVGWAFLITKLPFYFKEVHKFADREQGMIASTPLVLGMVGMLLGGVATDWATRRFGVRWGRAMPLAASRFLAAAAYLSCLLVGDPWIIALLLAFVAFGTDLGGASSWAFMQDVGGKYTGSVLGWCNMWGNLGASASSIVAGWVLSQFDTNGDWHEAFYLYAAAFVVAGIAALGVNASRPLTVRDDA